MKVYFAFVRHGETLFNQIRRMQGQCDSPLNQKGIRQAENTASALRNEHFDHIFCSSSERAWDTAKIIAQYHKEEPVFMKELREFDFGELDGQLFSEMNDIIQVHRRADDWTDVKGENVELFEKRAEKAFEKILSACRDNDHVLIACHGSYFSHLLKTLLHYDFDEYRNRMIEKGRDLVPNCSISKFVYEDGTFSLLSEPETADEYRSLQKKTVHAVIVSTQETRFETEGRLEGQCDSDLTENGIRKTEEIAEAIRQYKFARAYVSTSERARDTAEILLRKTDTKIIYERDLRERYLGTLEADNRHTYEDIIDYAQYGAESENDLENRAEKMIRTIYDTSCDQDTVLVVTHRNFAELMNQKAAEFCHETGLTFHIEMKG